MRSLFKQDDAFTGLEAAIVLIAFVVVAAVFSYVVLGAGFFTTQKSQEVVHTGVQQASSSMEIIGNVYGIASSAGNLQYVKFTIGNTAGGTGLDVTKMVVAYLDETVRSADVLYDSTAGTGLISNLKTAANGMDGTSSTTMGKWGIIEKINANDNNILEPGEQFVIGVSVPTKSTKPYTPFTINLQPSVGAVFTLQKTVPAAINDVNILY